MSTSTGNDVPRPLRRKSQSAGPCPPPTTSPCSSPCPPIDETIVNAYSGDIASASSSPGRQPQPRFLDGVLYQRTARNRYRYKTRRVTIDLSDGGTLLCRRDESIGAAQQQQRRSGSGSLSSKLLRRRNSATSTSAGSGASVVVSEREILQTLSLSSSFDSMRQQQLQRKRGRTFSTDCDSSTANSGSVATYQHDMYGPAVEASTYASLLADTNTDLDDVKLFLPSSVAWKMIDVKNDESLFVIEVPMPLPEDCILYSSRRDVSGGKSRRRLSMRMMASSSSNRSRTSTADSVDGLSQRLDDMSASQDYDTDLQTTSPSLDDSEASSLNCDSLRHHVYFKCPNGGNEKSLWLRVGKKLGRLSSSSKTRMSKSIVAPVKPRATSRWRKFNQMGVDGSSDAQHLDRMLSLRQSDFSETLLLETSLHRELDEETSGGATTKSAHEEEFKVYPTYCYPHRWMTNEELTHEMLGSSAFFHDLSEQTENVLIGGSAPRETIGRLELEMLCEYEVYQGFSFFFKFSQFLSHNMFSCAHVSRFP